MKHLVSQHANLASQERMEQYSEWNKSLRWQSQKISIDTHTTDLGHDDKVRKRNISGGWMRELSQRNGCRVLNVGCMDVGGSFMETHNHSASELWLYLLTGENWEILALLPAIFFLKITFQQLQKVPPKCLSFLAISYRSHTAFLYFLWLFLPLTFFSRSRAWPSYVLNQNPHVKLGWEKLIDKPPFLGTVHWKLSCVALESAAYSGDGLSNG